MPTGRPRLDVRPGVISDIVLLDRSPVEIAERNGISLRSVYVIADEAGISMSLRSEIMRLEQRKTELDKVIAKRKRELFK
jgi:hypothetical protein